ncbi:MAG TPA: hypothetical protein VEW48_09455 [Thermoanaerobaculia bacterium]|nr:hypothetical protein [Thermoanaerobaculia bacterium]
MNEERPSGGEWRADALERSGHSRLAGELRAPQDDFDEQRAEEICGAICRNLLGDFAPALLLLSAVERQRVQALLAYTHTLFDFARQHGVEGEKLAQINLWEMTLETALSGQPVGQPIFVRMAREERRQSWPTAALDDLTACARRRAVRPRPATPAEADADAVRLARAVATALLGQEPPGEVSDFLGALVRLRTLHLAGAEMERNRFSVARSELPDDWSVIGGRPDPLRVVEAVHRECARLRPRLSSAPRGLVELPPGYRRAAVFCLLAALRLLAALEDGGPEILETPPQLGVLARIGLLARARWLSGKGRTRTSTD